MPVRCEVSQWQITLITIEPVTGSPRRVTLRLQIETVVRTVITGKVINLEGTIVENFTGTCEVVEEGNVNRMSFTFPWARANINLTGVAFVEDSQPNIFAGKFAASARTDLREAEEIVAVAVPPESGDTGTGNGTQT